MWCALSSAGHERKRDIRGMKDKELTGHVLNRKMGHP